MATDVQIHIKHCLTAMKIMGTHPDSPRTLSWAFHITFAYLVLFMSSLFMIWHTYYNFQNKNFTAACQTGIFCFAFFGTTLNICVMLVHRKQIKNLLDIMKNDYMSMKDWPREDQLIHKKYMERERFLSKQWYLITIFSMGLFNAKAIVSMLYYYIIGETRLVNLHELNFPDIIEKRKDDLLIFIGVYLFMFYSGVYVCVNNLSFIPLGPILMLHACGHLEVTKRYIDELYNVKPAEVNDKLNEIVKRLQFTYNFVELVNGPFRLYYDVSLNLSSLILPVTFYALVRSVSRGEFSIQFSSFMLSGILMSSTPCYYSDLLLEKGEEVSLAIYSCGWEFYYDRRVRSTILILLIRSTRQIALRTVFKTLSLRTLADMFRQAYTIFSLMNAVLD